MNPIDWLAWIYGKFFVGHGWLGYFVVVVVLAAVFGLVWMRAVDKYWESHPPKPMVAIAPSVPLSIPLSSKDLPFAHIPEGVRITKPSPNEIDDQINALPPFQREAAARAYRGLEVCWQALFRTVEQKPLGGVVVKVKSYNPVSRYSSVMIAFDATLTPKLRIAKENECVLVRGTIADAGDGGAFWLADASIEFLD